MRFLPIYKILKNDLDLNTKISISDKGYEDVAPLGTKPPFIVWQTLTGQAMNDLDSPANFDSLQFQVMVYSSNTKEAYEIRDLVRKALEQRSWILNPAISNYDSASKIHGKGFDANWILER